MILKLKKIIISYLKFKKIYGSTKIRFNKPKKREVIIYDSESKPLVNYIFDLTNCEVLHVRYEELNLYILFITILKNGFSKIPLNYKINFIKYVSPKIVILDFTWNLAFFQLKSLYPNTKYICIQRSLANNNFFQECKKYLKDNPNKKLEADVIFVTGDYFNKQFSNFINAKVLSIGSVKNNFFYLKDQEKTKIRSILFISEANMTADNFDYKIRYNSKIVKTLLEYCKKNKLDLEVSIKHGKKAVGIFKKYFGSEGFKILPRENDAISYNLINKNHIIIFSNTTMGFEALAKGKKCIAFPLNEFPYTLLPERGLFWSKNFNYTILSDYLNKIIQIPDEEWKIQIKKNVKDFFDYDPKNGKLFFELSKLKVETLSKNFIS